mgnify:CR=1 FL=1
MKFRFALIAALLLFPVAALAAEPDLPVEVKTEQGIKYYNGGVGLGERAAMSQIFPLKVVLATEKGLYLNDADVKFVDSSGAEVLRVRADNGPWLVADLPAGTYTVEATLEGKTVSARGVRIKEGSRRITVLMWRTADVDMGL